MTADKFTRWLNSEISRLEKAGYTWNKYQTLKVIKKKYLGIKRDALNKKRELIAVQKNMLEEDNVLLDAITEKVLKKHRKPYVTVRTK